jgi:hypothetical protein
MQPKVKKREQTKQGIIYEDCNSLDDDDDDDDVGDDDDSKLL